MAFLPAIFASGAATAGAAGALSTAQMVALGLTIAGGVTQAVSQYKQGKLESKIDEANAAYSEQKAKDALSRGAEQGDLIRLQLRKIIGTQRAGFGAGNVDLLSGTPIDVAIDSARLAEQDIAVARNNAARESFGFRHEAQQFRRSAKLKRRSGTLGALATLLTTGAQAYGQYKKI